MEISGKIIWAGEYRSGINQQSGKQWASQDFVIQNVSNGPYGTITTNVCFNVFGDKIQQWQPLVGEEVTVGYGINAREYQGKWYNEVRAYKYERKEQQPIQQFSQQNNAQASYTGQPAQMQGQYQAPNQFAQQTAAAHYGEPYGTQAPY